MTWHADLWSANLYAANRKIGVDMAQLVALNPRLVGCQEAGHWLSRLEDIGTLYVDRLGLTWSREVATLSRGPGITYAGQGTELMAPDLGTRVAPARGGHWTRLELDGQPLAHVNMHPHAAIQGRGGKVLTGTKRVDAYAEQMGHLLPLMVEYHRAAGWPPVLTGDLNYYQPKAGVPVPWWAPPRLLPSLGLDYYVHGVDYVAWDRDTFAAGPRKLHTPAGADHDWIGTRLQLR